MPHREPIEAEVARAKCRTSRFTTADSSSCGGCTRITTRADKVAALAYLEAHRAMGEVVTGLLYVEDDPLDLHDAQNTVDVPLNALSDAELVPGSAALAAFNAKLA
jgi:hypothetical protein